MAYNTLAKNVGQINAGKYNKRITIYKIVKTRDSDGFQQETKEVICQPYADVKTTRGFTLIVNNSDFEKAFTNFTVRYSKKIIEAYYDSEVEDDETSNRDMLIDFNNKTYLVQYLNNIDEANIEIEMQAKEVLH